MTDRYIPSPYMIRDEEGRSCVALHRPQTPNSPRRVIQVFRGRDELGAAVIVPDIRPLTGRKDGPVTYIQSIPGQMEPGPKKYPFVRAIETMLSNDEGVRNETLKIEIEDNPELVAEYEALGFEPVVRVAGRTKNYVKMLLFGEKLSPQES